MQSMDKPHPGAQAAPLATPDRTRASLPAWLMSLILHAAALLVVAAAWRGTVSTPREDLDRPVSIVLVDRSDLSAREYFAREAGDETAAATRSDRQPGDATPGGGLEDLLPPAEAADPLLLDAALPTPADGFAAADPAGKNLAPLPTAGGFGRPRILPGLGDDEILAGDPLRHRPALGPAGPTAKLRVFGRVGEGRSFVFLIDRSKSMGGEGLGALGAAERELVRELHRLKAEHRFQIIAYNQSYTALDRAGMLPASEPNKALAARFLSTVVAAGSTEHEPPLTAALRLKPDVIFLLTDGGEPPLSRPEIELLTRENGGRTAIHCLHFGAGPLQQSDNFLARLARLNRGTYDYVDMLEDRSR
jgi:hypothetical protein